MSMNNFLNSEQRVFKRYYFTVPKPAKINKDIFEQNILIHDLSLDGVCFTLEQHPAFKLSENMIINIESSLPDKAIIAMKIDLLNAKFPIYRGIWNPINQLHGIALTQWLKRIFGNENELYTRDPS